MPADEVDHGTDAKESRARTGPRHAAPRKPLFTRFHMPAGKAMALAAMPTAVFMGLGLNSTLARAEDQPAAKSLTADEYQKCVEALTGSKDSADPSATPSPSASADATQSAGAEQPAPSATADTTPDKTSDKTSDNTSDEISGGASSADPGSGGKAEPIPSASASSSLARSPNTLTAGPTPSPSASASGGNLLDDLGNTLKDALTPGEGSPASAEATPSPSASASATEDSAGSASKTVADTTEKVTDTVTDTVRSTADAGDTAAEAAPEPTPAASDTAQPSAPATTSPSESASPSASETPSPEDCPAATDAQGGVEGIVALPDDPWHLEASSLLLKGADYKGVVQVRTANGTVKKALKYVVSGGTDIGDLHQIVDGPNGVTYHVQAAKGSTSTIRDGDTVMYTESISGNLFGLIPVTFTPDNPPPLNIPLIYFTKVKIVQAGQFGGTLHLPGMHQYTTGAN
ncbi:hypothetical protein [Streptomyces colonosanans]|uniref:Membrane-bound hydrophilic protein n=1 Tax=Streptomyces colonosanans TaxID=1428652 RepID=A0A1S2PXL9_9ACTN|nr:hypothetical protein [Streptomyces colonosanans]OIJ98579.1 hypothetical protein BIV24_05660 [Streptomyces colonosanans]